LRGLRSKDELARRGARLWWVFFKGQALSVRR
jgi:hypothetical protein